MSNLYNYSVSDPQQNKNLEPHMISLLFLYCCIWAVPWTCICACQLIDNIQAALLLGNALVSGETGFGVSMHNHSAHYHLVVCSESYQQNACVEVFLISNFFVVIILVSTDQQSFMAWRWLILIKILMPRYATNS